MFELRLLSPGDDVETVCDALEALDALSVSVEDADAHTSAEQALYGEPGMPVPQEGWQRSLVVALFADEAGAREAARLLAAQEFFAASSVVGVQTVPEQDWVRLTQAQQVIRLDPGMAFGTGTHPTTRMCLRWLAQQPAGKDWGRVLDYGCGSGILAIGAAKFGATEIDAVDIDPAAVESTQINAANNHVSLRTGLPDFVDPAQGAYRVVIANILATPLKVLAPLLCGHVQKGGHLVLAGILERQAQELQEAYAPYLQLQVADTQEGWILMTGQRQA